MAFDEKVDMLLVYGECHKKKRDAARYPDRPHASRSAFARLEKQARSTGSLSPRKRKRAKRFTKEEAEIISAIIDVLASLYDFPHISTREISNGLGATFVSTGEVNRQNMDYWSVTNPHWMRTADRQRRWLLNVCCGIVGTKIIGPHFFYRNLNGPQFAEFIRETLPVLLDDVPIQT
ncbi:hypothetical protein J6590_097573, partial [Homalodisca vitripennis]